MRANIKVFKSKFERLAIHEKGEVGDFSGRGGNPLWREGGRA